MFVKKLVFFLLLNLSHVDIVVKQTVRPAGSPEEKKVAAAIKKINDEIKKQQEDVQKLLDKIVAAIERSCSGELQSVIICERKRKTIICTHGTNIYIQEALYGRLDFKTCSKSSSGGIFPTSCRAARSLSIAQSKCQGRASCVLYADNAVFGDPCPGIYKYLLVKYKCVEY